jgi:hypothetical protein
LPVTRLGRSSTAWPPTCTLRGKDYIEIIIDPGTGEYIGDREVTAEEDMGIQPGSVRAFSAVTMGVVDAPWVVPAK